MSEVPCLIVMIMSLRLQRRVGSAMWERMSLEGKNYRASDEKETVGQSRKIHHDIFRGKSLVPCSGKKNERTTAFALAT